MFGYTQFCYSWNKKLSVVRTGCAVIRLDFDRCSFIDSVRVRLHGGSVGDVSATARGMAAYTSDIESLWLGTLGVYGTSTDTGGHRPLASARKSPVSDAISQYGQSRLRSRHGCET